MSIYNLTITISANTQVNKNADGDYETAVEFKPPHVNGIELAGNEQTQKLGKEGAQAAVIATLTAVLNGLTNPQKDESEGVPTNVPGASA